MKKFGTIEKQPSHWRGVGIFIGISFICMLIIVLIGKLVKNKNLFGKNKIAIIKVTGMITSSEKFIKELDGYTKNPTVKAMVIRVNSPGGGVAASQEIYQAVKRITDDTNKKRVKIVVSMGSVAASGGYYISCAADSIVANPGTLTGSLGVIMEFPYLEELLKKVGVKSRSIKSGVFKDIGSPFREMKPDERELLQEMIDDVYDQFVEAISDGRGLSKEEVRKIADGRILSGRQAKRIGLVDELGGMRVALERAAALAGIKLEKAVILREEDDFKITRFLSGIGRFMENISGRLGQSTPPVQYLWR